MTASVSYLVQDVLCRLYAVMCCITSNDEICEGSFVAIPTLTKIKETITKPKGGCPDVNDVVPSNVAHCETF